MSDPNYMYGDYDANAYRAVTEDTKERRLRIIATLLPYYGNVDEVLKYVKDVENFIDS